MTAKAESALRVHAPPAEEASAEKPKKWRKNFKKFGKRHHGVLLYLDGHKDGNTVAEMAAAMGRKHGSIGGVAREMIAMGLAQYDGVRQGPQDGAHIANIVKITETGRVKARWLLSDPDRTPATDVPELKEDSHGS